MCRARPGPRCSDTGSRRMHAASNHYAAMVARDGTIEAAGRRPTARQRRSTANALKRVEAAKRVYYATPAGQKSLRESIESDYNHLNTLDFGTPASTERDAFERALRRVERREQALEEGAERRKNSYRDLSLVKEERSQIREVNRARGGTMGPNGHPTSRQLSDAEKQDKNRALSFKPWDDEQVARAESWVETGTETQWQENDATKPPVSIRGSETEIGTEKAVPSSSKAFRMNCPDGNIVEARFDTHITKNSDGKFVVTTRQSVASSWEDASGIDQTTSQLGRLMGTDAEGSRSRTNLVGAYDSLEAAQAAATTEQGRISETGYASAAKTGRNMFINKARRTALPLQNSGTGAYTPETGRVNRGRQAGAWFRYRVTADATV